MRSISGRLGLVAAVGALALAGGCSQGGDSPAAAGTASAPPLPAPSSQPAVSSSTATPPVTTTTAEPTPQPATTAAPGGDGCGTVHAASGLTLRVQDGSSAGMTCAQATDLVARFQRQITGKQPSGSNDPVSATVDGWLCVSGPPSAQGGTTCSKQDLTVFAGAVTGE
ncbi:hypothetical protein [Amycolatopsis sp.]|uniref:hypothetical protein n=1 Tax=Amycolatopsis sp. TaxID=37632 RepID=UPI002CC4501C|nr:hypothetical protein [Amycolatopsis sp.]HVV10604.1 hypothetical protein [Amycolatopsis sp.]